MNDQSKATDKDTSDSPENGTPQCCQDKSHLMTAYEHICDSYHKIDDFRAKLLGFLPLASGAGIFLLLNDALAGKDRTSIAKAFLVPIGVFGLLATLGLFLYELYGIRKCGRLIDAGKTLEKELGWSAYGQFSTRPDVCPNPKRFGMLNEPFAAGFVYPAVLGAWAYLALFGLGQQILAWSAWGLTFVLGVFGMLVYDCKLRRGTVEAWVCKQEQRPCTEDDSAA